MRVYETLRSAHLERAQALDPSSIIYRSRRYDFDASLAEGLDVLQAGTTRMVLLLAASRVRYLEVNEPLMRGGLRRTATAMVIARWAARIRRRPLTIGAYAIENKDPHSAAPAAPLRTRAGRRLDRGLSLAVAARLDRIVYGTDAAAALYQVVFRHLPVQSTVIPALPSPCRCADSPDGPDGAQPGSPDVVLYLGALVPRKGFDRLLTAWPLLAGPPADAPGRTTVRLQIVGKGALAAKAQALVDADPRVQLAIDPPRNEVHTYLRRARVLVLLSQPMPEWREQVGLPIIEALSHGCVVVTTTETGLAGWLAEHGHEVLAPESSPEAVGAAIRSALDRGPSCDQILRSLPTVDGRLAADAWLFAPGSSLPTPPKLRSDP